MKYIILITIVFLLAGCTIDFGATDRTQIQANAAVAVAQAERDAAIGAAQAEASKAKAWAAVAVPLALIIMGGIVAAVVVWWQGKIHHERAMRLLPGQPGFYPALRQVARRQNAEIVTSGSHYYLVSEDDSQEVQYLQVAK